jgi:hypothetical protein
MTGGRGSNEYVSRARSFMPLSLATMRSAISGVAFQPSAHCYRKQAHAQQTAEEHHGIAKHTEISERAGINERVGVTT